MIAASSKVLEYIQSSYPVIGVWIVFRAITSITAAVASAIRPITDLEQRIAIWPPTTPISDWLERMLISPWNRWDVEWYTRIILNGYNQDDGTVNFHPLYPWLGKLLSILKLDPVLSLLIISSIAVFLMLLFLKKLLALDFDQEQANLAMFIFLVFPISFILFAPYAESLFLLFAIICFYSLRKRNWRNAAISAFLAVLTRQQGLFLFFPFAWELWNATGRNIVGIKRQWKEWIMIFSIPIGYIFWIGYRNYVLEESILKTGNINAIIYSVFITPAATKVVPQQSFMWPWNTLYLGYNKIINSPDIDIWINTLLAIFFILIIIIGWKKMAPSARLFSVVIYLVSFGYYTGPVHPVMGLPRHLLLAFPTFIGFGQSLVKSKFFLWSYIFISILFMLILITAYTLKAWVP